MRISAKLRTYYQVLLALVLTLGMLSNLALSPAWGQTDGQDASTKAAQNRRAKRASSDSPAQIVLGTPQSMLIHYAGKECNVQACSTGVDDEYLVQANAADWVSIASYFGKSLSWKRHSLTVRDGSKEWTLSRDQNKMPDDLGGRQLDVSITNIKGVDYFPVSVLEEMLKVRVTVNGNGKEAWIEPLITSVAFEGDGRNPNLVVKVTTPINIKTFVLSKPDRYVIDVYDAVLDTAGLRINHPDLGDVRLGQFTLGPARSRIVVPMPKGTKIKSPGQTTGTKFVFNITMPKTAGSSEKLTKQRMVDCDLIRNESGASTLWMQFSGPVKYSWTRLVPPDNRFFLDVENVVLVGKRREYSIDSDILKSVRVSQYATSPVPVTRVVFDLKKAIQVNVRLDKKPYTLNIDFTNEEINANASMLKGYGITSSSVASAPQAVSGGKGVAGTICIDPGHGGSDPGAVSPNGTVYEKTATFNICTRLGKILRSRGWKVVFTREDDRDVSYAGSSASEELWARVDVAHKANADIFLSVHCNASVNYSAGGTSLHTYKTGDRAFAKCLYSPLLKATGLQSRGISQDRFYVLVHSRMPAVLVETAFISNAKEAGLLNSDEFCQKVAEGLADGIGIYANSYLK